MILAMNRSTVLLVLVFIIVAFVSLSLTLGYTTDPNEVLASRGNILLLMNGFILLLGLRKVLWVVHKLTLARYWWFPWLDGEWQAEIRSNWPKVKKTLEAAKDKSITYDPLNEPPPDGAEALTKANVTIKVSLFEIFMEISPENTDRVSRTRFVRPRWAKPDRPELSYVYEQEDTGTIAVTDAKTHLGAGLVRYDETRDQLVGDYWTDRRSDAALNTAGRIVMRRIKKKSWFADIFQRWSFSRDTSQGGEGHAPG